MIRWSPSLGPQNRELRVAGGLGDGRFDGGHPRSGRPLGAPGKKGVDCRRVAFDVDQDGAVRLVADPTSETALACLALGRDAVFDALHDARDTRDDAYPRLMRHADSLVRTIARQQACARDHLGGTMTDKANWHKFWTRSDSGLSPRDPYLGGSPGVSM